jgi:hypothetical protein
MIVNILILYEGFNIFSGLWGEGTRYFQDISPLGGKYVIDQIKVDTTSAKWCSNNITLNFYLQNKYLGLLFIESEECECFTCPYPYSFVKSLNNFTEYNYGGMNSLRVDSGFILILL